MFKKCKVNAKRLKYIENFKSCQGLYFYSGGRGGGGSENVAPGRILNPIENSL